MDIRKSWSIGLIGILLAGCVSATLTGWYYAKEDAEQRANERFRFRAKLVKAAIVERMKAYEQVLRGGVALFQVDDNVTRADWHGYVANLKIENNYPGIQGIGFAKHIPPDELAAHIQQVRAEGFPEYVVKPAGERAEYTAIIYLEPFDQRNRRAFGFDMFSEPMRHAAMEQARDSGESAFSGRVTLLQETRTDVQAGFLMYLPVYRHGMPLGNVEQRRAALLGYVYSPFRMNNLMRGILGDQEEEVTLQIYDGSSVRTEGLMYDSGIRRPKQAAQFFLSEKLSINGHAWFMDIRSKPAFEATVDRQKPLFILAFGLFISGLMALLAWAWLSTRTRAQGMAHDMTQAVREREERLRSIVDTAVDGIIVINQRGIVESFNVSAERIFGYTAAEVIGRNINMLMPEPYRSAHDGYLQRYTQTNEARIIGIGREVMGLRKDGSIFPLDLAVGEMKMQGGLRLFTGIVRDISERVAAKNQLREQEKFANDMIENLTVPTFIIDPQHRVLKWNKACEELTGVKATDVLGTSEAWRGFYPHARPCLADLVIDNATETGSQHYQHFEPSRFLPHGVHAEGWFPNMGGKRRYVIFDAVPLFNEQGKMVAAIESLQDITERKQAEELLHEALSLQHAILNSTNYSIISTDVDGMIRTFNSGAERMLGYRSDELVGKHTPAIIHLPEEVVARASTLSSELGQVIEPGFEVFVAKAREGIADENEWTYVRKDGSHLPVLLSVTALRNEQEEVTGFLGVAYDVTERKKVERLKNEFVSTVSHELRTPLTSIRGSLGLLLGNVTGELPLQAKGLVEIAHKNSERLVRLINDILDVEKIESGMMHFDIKPQALMPIVEHAIEANQAYGEQYGTSFELMASLPQAQVNVDNDRLVQVMSNLLSNAAKFSPKGGRVEITVTHEPGFIRVAVSDHGPGIPQEFRDKIFQKFSQADSSDTRQKGGTGLGLSITKAIVEKMGGEIGFDTQAGVGTTFYFRLPEWGNNNTVLSGQNRSNMARPVVLVCEDDADVAQLISMMLAQGGFDTETAGSVNQARKKLGERSYAAMTLDLGLPDGDGIALIHELRGQKATRHLPIVVVSGRASEAHQAALNGSFPVVDWLGKPIDNDALVVAVQRAVHSFSGYKPRILQVEDDPDIRQIVGAMVANIADIDYAESILEATAMLGLERYNLVILDIGLPDGSGWELLPQIKCINPPPHIVVFSANNVAQDMARQVAAALVKSQTSDRELLETISMLVRKKPA